MGSERVNVEIKNGTPPPGFTLNLVFDTGLQVDFTVTHYEPKFDNGRLVSAEIRQDGLMPGDMVVSHIEWKRVIFAAVYSLNPAFQK